MISRNNGILCVTPEMKKVNTEEHKFSVACAFTVEQKEHILERLIRHFSCHDCCIHYSLCLNPPRQQQFIVTQVLNAFSYVMLRISHCLGSYCLTVGIVQQVLPSCCILIGDTSHNLAQSLFWSTATVLTAIFRDVIFSWVLIFCGSLVILCQDYCPYNNTVYRWSYGLFSCSVTASSKQVTSDCD